MALVRWVGRRCLIHILIGGRDLFYTVREVLSVSDKHISFIDRNGSEFVFRVEDIKEISEVK